MQNANQIDFMSPPAKVPASLTGALVLLLEAYDEAKELGCPLWELALEMSALANVGATNTALRSLLSRGYAEHADEITQPRTKKRTFRPRGNLALTDKTCFVFTETGVELARQVCAQHANGSVSTHATEPPVEVSTSQCPSFIRCDDGHRELRLHQRVVKSFKTHADSQETILLSFQELGWPRWIDDPLPRIPNQEPKQRLHNAITRLNRHQVHALIRFHGDGNGKAVFWDLASEVAGRATAD